MMNQTITIGITNSKRYLDYSNWVHNAYPQTQIIQLAYQQNNAFQLSQCHALILTGGEDVHPVHYHHPEYLQLLNPQQIDSHRDQFELHLIEQALKQKKPILGICRGLQITNVFFGGTLIPDIPSILDSHQHGKINGQDQLHSTTILENTQLHQIIQQSTLTINSAHHQSAHFIGSDLKPSSISDSNIIEALEWQSPSNKSWLTLVQWHPERIPTYQQASIAILNELMSQAVNYKS